MTDIEIIEMHDARISKIFVDTWFMASACHDLVRGSRPVIMLA